MTPEQRVPANSDAITRILGIQETTLELIRQVKLEIGEVKQLQVDQQKQMAVQQAQLEEMRRFNEGTRKLWVAIAKKVEWLDEDDWPKD